MDASQDRPPSVFPVLFAMVLPSFVTWLYFVALADEPAAVQQVAYSVGKAVQFGFPAVWVWWTRGVRKPTAAAPGGLPVASGFGIGVAVAMVVLYYAWLGPSGLLAEPAEVIRRKVTETGFSSTLGYLGLGAFYVVFHSLLEEYYWRWFVYRELRRRTSVTAAVFLSSCGFMAHHVLLLAVYFGWTSPFTYLFSLAVAIGGAAWAWIYERFGSLLAPWFSHAFVDAAIFAIGYDIVKEQLR